MRTGLLRVLYLSALVLSGQTTPVKYAKSQPISKSGPFKAVAREQHANSNVSLPVKKVILYKNGVGYFEPGGRVRGNQEPGIAARHFSFCHTTSYL
jgi:hypothetical protein